MQICMVVYYYWPENAGGAENQCRKLSQSLAAKGHNVTVLTAQIEKDLPTKDIDCGVQINRLPNFELFLKKSIHYYSNFYSNNPQQKAETTRDSEEENYLLLIKRVVNGWISTTASRIVRYLNSIIFSLYLFFFLHKNRENYSILHIHTADWLAGVVAWIGCRYNIPVICKGADIPVFPEISDIPFAGYLDKFRKKPYFIALTEAMADDLVQGNVPQEKITLIPNGVVLPQQNVFKEESVNFLFLGNFSQTAAHKGFDILLQAWALVVQEEIDAQLVMAGGGDSSPWKAMAENLRIKDNVTFTGYRTDIENLFANSCCLVLPSRKEGISNALLEAQSYGLPAIVSDIPGNRAVIIDSLNGLVVPVGDSLSLSRAILTLLRSPSLRKRFSIEARSRIEAMFSIESIASQVEALYSRLIR